MGSVVIDVPAAGSVDCYLESVFSGRELLAHSAFPFCTQELSVQGLKTHCTGLCQLQFSPWDLLRPPLHVSVELLLMLNSISLTVLEALLLRANPNKQPVCKYLPQSSCYKE